MNSHFEFQYPWLLALLALLPVYAFLRGRGGKLSALRFPSADIARAAGGAARSAAGRLLHLPAAADGGLVHRGAGRAALRQRPHRDAGQRRGHHARARSVVVHDGAGHGRGRASGSRASTSPQDVLEDFIRKRPSDRIGLIVFSAVPYLASPLTLNHDWLIENLHRLHVGMIRDLGTAIGDATAAGGQAAQGAQGQQEPHHHPADRRRQQQGRHRPGARRAACRRHADEALHDRHRHRAALHAAGVRPGHGQAAARSGREPHPHHCPAARQLQGAGQDVRASPGASSIAPPTAGSCNASTARSTGWRRPRSSCAASPPTRPLFQWPLLAAFALLAMELVLATTRYRRIP